MRSSSGLDIPKPLSTTLTSFLLKFRITQTWGLCPGSKSPHSCRAILTPYPMASTEFWRHYVIETQRHDRAEVDQNGRIVDAFALFVARDVKRALAATAANGETGVRLTEQARRLFEHMTLAATTTYVRQSIVTYGIRDWARAPYGAANHGWQPGVRFWKVIAFRHDETRKLCATGYIMSQRDMLPGAEFVFGRFQLYQAPIAEIERRTELAFGKLKEVDALRVVEEAPPVPLQSPDQIRFVEGGEVWFERCFGRRSRPKHL